MASLLENTDLSESYLRLNIARNLALFRCEHLVRQTASLGAVTQLGFPENAQETT